MAWTTPKTWTVGEVLTAAGLNEQLRDNASYLKAVSGSVAPDGTATGSGFSSVKNSTGNYTVTFSVAFSTAPVVVATPNGYSLLYLDSIATTGFQAHGRNTSAGAQDIGFTFVARLS